MNLAFALPKQQYSSLLRSEHQPFPPAIAELGALGGYRGIPYISGANCPLVASPNSIGCGGKFDPPTVSKCCSWHSNPSLLLLRTCGSRWGCWLFSGFSFLPLSYKINGYYYMPLGLT